MADLVSLNVGDVIYTTSRTTLTAYPNSMLGRMFGGDLPTARDSEGKYFIDRDGQLFRHVLNFLRTGELNIPDDFPELSQLKSEADFYQVESLTAAVDAENERRKCSQNIIAPVIISHHLDVIENTEFSITKDNWGNTIKLSEKIMVLIGNIDVLKQICLTDMNLSKALCDPPRMIPNRPMYKSPYDDIDVVSNGGKSTQIVFRTFKGQANRDRSNVSKMNRTDLANFLLSIGCTLVGSSSEYIKTPREIRCSDKWLIPASSLQHLSNFSI